MTQETKYNAIIRNIRTGEIIKRVECKSESQQQRTVMGMCIIWTSMSMKPCTKM
jgi:hypothetical protein